MPLFHRNGGLSIAQIVTQCEPAPIRTYIWSIEMIHEEICYHRCILKWPLHQQTIHTKTIYEDICYHRCICKWFCINRLWICYPSGAILRPFSQKWWLIDRSNSDLVRTISKAVFHILCWDDSRRDLLLEMSSKTRSCQQYLLLVYDRLLDYAIHPRTGLNSAIQNSRFDCAIDRPKATNSGIEIRTRRACPDW